MQNEDRLALQGQSFSFILIENIGVTSWWGGERTMTVDLAEEERDH